jgi:hypothetical protein
MDDLKYFYNFNRELIINFQKSMYEYAYSNRDFFITKTDDIVNDMNDYFFNYVQKAFLAQSDKPPYPPLKLNIYYYNKTQNKIFYSTDTTINEFKVQLTPTLRPMFYMTSSKDTGVFNMFNYDSEYFTTTKNETISCYLPFYDWAKLSPSLMLDICKQNVSNPFFYNLTGYKSTVNTQYGEFTAPITNFDAAGNLSTVVVCSLRLVNSNYTKKCCQITDINNNQRDIGFDLNTSMISYKELDKIIDNTGTWRVTKFYNQMEQNKKDPTLYFTQQNYKNAPAIKYIKNSSNIKIYYLEWSQNNFMTLSGNIDTSNINYPYMTVFMNLNNTPKEDINTQTNLYTGSSKFSSYLYTKNNDIFFGGPQNYNQTSFSDFQNINRQSFYTISATYDAVQISNNISYKQEKSQKVQPGGGSPNYPNNFTWFDQNNTITMNGSEMIIFLTDGVSVDKKILDDISKDNYNIWKYTSNIRNIDVRCNNTVETACKQDRTNPICACYPSYYDNTSTQVNKLISTLDKSMINSDRWCINPACANSVAYKNPLTKGSSVCSSMCLSALYANTQKYGNLNIDNTQIMSLCDNQSSRSNQTSPCPDPCDKDSICAFNNSTQQWGCVQKTSCTEVCKDGYQCIIDGENKQRCVPKENSIKKCVDSSDCSSKEYCDSSGICLEKAEKPKIYIEIIIFVVILIIGIIFTKLTRINMKFGIFLSVLLSIVITVIYHFISKNSENYTEEKTTCYLSSDCL